MIRYEVVAARADHGYGDSGGRQWEVTGAEGRWGLFFCRRGLFFCQKGGRVLGLRWKEGTKAVVEVSRRPIRDGVPFVVRTLFDAELSGEELPTPDGSYAVAPIIHDEAERWGLLGKTLYVRAKALSAAPRGETT